jgi:hypothetical protein
LPPPFSSPASRWPAAAEANRTRPRPSGPATGRHRGPSPQGTGPHRRADRPPTGRAGRRASPVRIKRVDPDRRTITFDLIQFYWGDDATREAAKDHQESPPPNDYYIRNINPGLRTLPVRADATITCNTLTAGYTGSVTKDVPVQLYRLDIVLPSSYSPPFWITVRHGQVVRIAEQYVP